MKTLKKRFKQLENYLDGKFQQLDKFLASKLDKPYARLTRRRDTILLEIFAVLLVVLFISGASLGWIGIC